MQALNGIFPTLLASSLVEILCILVYCGKPDRPRPLPLEHFFVVQKVINLSSNLIYSIHIFIESCCLSSSSPCLAFNRSQVFSKVNLLQATRPILHLFIFSNKHNIGLPISWIYAQEVLIRSSHLGWATNFSSKRCIFVFQWWCNPRGPVVNKMGSWSE